jgi:prepilin-type N-terminal cleavage/methylation domain-containing protein
MHRRSRAFTLLEVMAAVAIIAIVFSTLARVASQGLASEGASKRRLEASLLADATLAVIEIQLADGAAPEIGESEEEVGLFQVVTTVSSFDLASAIPIEGLEVDDPTTAASLAGVLGDEVSPIREIRVAVSWAEGVHDYLVIRTTYGIDPVALESLANPDAPDLPALAPPPTT